MLFFSISYFLPLIWLHIDFLKEFPKGESKNKVTQTIRSEIGKNPRYNSRNKFTVSTTSKYFRHKKRREGGIVGFIKKKFDTTKGKDFDFADSKKLFYPRSQRKSKNEEVERRGYKFSRVEKQSRCFSPTFFFFFISNFPCMLPNL